MTMPVFVRMYQVQDTFGVSDDTVRRWEERGLISILRRGRISGVRTQDVLEILEQGVGQDVGQRTAKNSNTLKNNGKTGKNGAGGGNTPDAAWACMAPHLTLIVSNG